jgi:two-component system, NarL family, sensor kinase
MSGYSQEDGSAAVTMAVLRATLVAVIFASEQLTEAKQLAGVQFYAVLVLAAVYALVAIAVAVAPSGIPGTRALVRAEPGIDVLLLTALAYTSGGAFSDVRKAFFVVPLAAAFSERPRLTANWSLLAVAAFTMQAVIAGGHPAGIHNSWPRMTLNQDLYLTWTGVAATMLALALRQRTARTEGLARSRQRLVTQAIESVERERTRLAGALHDSPVQNLIAARHDLRRAERSGDQPSFQRLHEAIDVTIAQLREEIFNLHPHVLDHVGLSAALEQVARRHAGEGEVHVSVEVEPAGAHLADRQVLFALGRELLGNAAKHAQASEIRLTLECRTGGVILQVTDDGCGISDGRIRQALLDGHIGLASVSERVAALGGALSISTAAGAGTTVAVTLPATQVAPELASAARMDPLAVPATAEISDRRTPHDTLGVSPA